jgi:hypothetical protein
MQAFLRLIFILGVFHEGARPKRIVAKLRYCVSLPKINGMRQTISFANFGKHLHEAQFPLRGSEKGVFSNGLQYANQQLEIRLVGYSKRSQSFSALLWMHLTKNPVSMNQAAANWQPRQYSNLPCALCFITPGSPPTLS